MPPLPRFPSRPRTPRRRLALAVIGGAALVVLVGSGCAARRLQTAAELARRSEPFEAAPASPAKRLLVVGDSTGVGTGASSPQTSLAGLIARDHPDWLVVNRSRDGARFDDIAKQLEEAGRGAARFDIVLVLGGGNDVIRLTPEITLRTALQRSVAQARALAPHVVLMPSGNVGNAPFFWPPWSWWMSARSRRLHRAVGELAEPGRVHYVRLYQEAQDDPFVQQAALMNADDGLHPSDAGYESWYAELRRQAPAVFGR